MGDFIVELIRAVYNFLWGDLFVLPLPGGQKLPLSLLVIILIPAGIYFTVKTRFLPIRLFPDMIHALLEKKDGKGKQKLPLSLLVIILIPAGIYFTVKTRFLPIRLFPDMIHALLEKKDGKGKGGALSVVQSLIVSTATRVGMGNLVGVVAAISAGGAGAVFWMWVTALIGSSTAFIEATLAQLYKEKDPLYGGFRGGPAYYIHKYLEEKSGKVKRYRILPVLFAISGLICWCGISQVISNSVTSAFDNAFHIPPLYTTIALVVLAAIIVLRKNATVKVLDVLVPIMAGCYFVMTIVIIVLNIGQLPAVFSRIFAEAFGIRQVVAGGFGAVIMNGVKRGLFSNEAGSGSAPCAAATAETDHPAKVGLVQALGVFIDTIVICSCTAFIMLLTPAEFTCSRWVWCCYYERSKKRIIFQ